MSERNKNMTDEELENVFLEFFKKQRENTSLKTVNNNDDKDNEFELIKSYEKMANQYPVGSEQWLSYIEKASKKERELGCRYRKNTMAIAKEKLRLGDYKHARALFLICADYARDEALKYIEMCSLIEKELKFMLGDR